MYRKEKNLATDASHEESVDSLSLLNGVFSWSVFSQQEFWFTGQYVGRKQRQMK